MPISSSFLSSLQAYFSLSSLLFRKRWQKLQRSLQQRFERAFYWLSFACLLIVVVTKVYLGFALPVSEDGAYYLYWADNLDWGYPEHPPLLAVYLWACKTLMQFLSTLIMPAGIPLDAETVVGGVRSITLLFYSAVSVLLFYFGKQFGDTNVGGWLMLGAFWLIPNFFGLTLFITPDTLLVPFLLLSLFAFCYAFFLPVPTRIANSTAKGVFNGKQSKHFLWKQDYWYIVAGLLAGFSLLAKVSAIVPLSAVYIYGFFFNRRRSVGNLYFWISVLIPVVMFSPLLLWSAKTDFLFFQHLFSLTSQSFVLERFIIFYVNQVFLFGPMFLLLLPYVLFFSLKSYWKKKGEVEFSRGNPSLLSLLLSIANFVLFAFFVFVVFMLGMLKLALFSIAGVCVFALLLSLSFRLLNKNQLDDKAVGILNLQLDRVDKSLQKRIQQQKIQNQDHKKEYHLLIKRKEEARHFLFFFSFVTLCSLVFLLVKSFFHVLYPNWSVIAIISAMPLFVLFLEKRMQDAHFAAQLGVRQFFFLATYLLAFVLLFNIRSQMLEKYPNSLGRASVFYKYSVFNEEALDYYYKHMDKTMLIAGNNYQIPSHINLFWRPPIDAATVRVDAYHPVIFDITFSQTPFIGKDIYYMFSRSDKLINIGNLWNMCGGVLKLRSFHSKLENKKIASFDLYRCNDFQGSTAGFFK